MCCIIKRENRHSNRKILNACSLDITIIITYTNTCKKLLFSPGLGIQRAIALLVAKGYGKVK